MAQALFDEHPLEEYLRNAGEARDLVPGTTAELELELDPLWDMYVDEDEHETDKEWRPLFLIYVMEMVDAAMLALDLSSQPSPFVERFKYDVISSSLLAVNLSSPHGRTPQALLSIPGQMDHSRSSSITAQYTALPIAASSSTDPSYLIPSFASLMVAVFLGLGYTLLALISFASALYTFRAVNEISKNDMSPSLESLNDLIAASNEWESVVQAAISVLDNDEQNTTSWGAMTPISPTTSLRIAINSSLLTTQTQCDNIRQLLSALTSPSELSQLSEMYAPPSPMTSYFSYDAHTRPLSLPARKRTLSMPDDPFATIKDPKRQTWNGPHHIPDFSSPINQAFTHRPKRRSDLSSLLQPSSNLSPKTASAPVTPSLPSLAYVSEEEPEEQSSNIIPHSADGSPTFGAAALSLHRKRKSAGMDAFKIPPPSYFSPVPSPRLTPQTPRTAALSSTFPSGSRLTPIQTPRHPLSLSALQYALQGALASKRYACSHLLALRFADEDDEGYWEDVRSVVGLLTSTLSDTSARLSDALTEVEQQRLRDQNPTPSSLVMHDSDEGDRSMSVDSSESVASPPPRSRIRPMSISFAPLPSHLSRFAAHVDAIKGALDDAKINLEQCVAALREEASIPNSRKTKRESRPTSISSAEESVSGPALEAYERLRREIGLALRECERGRARLLDVICPPEFSGMDDDEFSDDVPLLGHDGSDESDKMDPAYPLDIEVEQDLSSSGFTVVIEGAEESFDDVASRLLAVSTQHLPPLGIEQVFEADSGNVGEFTRERSKLSRDERIKLAKTRRDGGLKVDLSSPVEKVSSSVEKWGPSGEVVQELKDVIWKVGERRRRMAGTLSTPLELDPQSTDNLAKVS